MSIRQSETDEARALLRVVEGTAGDTGERFFHSLVDSLRAALGTMGAWIAVLDPKERRLRAVSMKMRDDWLDGFAYRVEGTPCEVALDERRVVHIPDRLVQLYAGDPGLGQYGPVSYMGVPLFANDGRIIGQLAVLDDKPMAEEPTHTAIFRIFAHRAAAELERLEAERAVREREAQLRSLVGATMDAIVDFDDLFIIKLTNPAARRLLECGDSGAPPADARDLFDASSRARLERAAADLAAPEAERSSQWLVGGLSVVTCHGRMVRVEATLSRYQVHGQTRMTLILRSLDDRLEAERRIVSLTREAEYLRERLDSLEQDEHILGTSPALSRALYQLEQVAPTTASVLLLGETGTGKELFARAVHARSARAERPLVTLNCAAIPVNLLESELFGHEKGAFTGAVRRREGRFQLANGGSLFLDEIGELPLELQPKLLRALQEGEIVPVGSEQSVRVDVRIVAATHRDLVQCVARGTFREDLYYRLAVFPVQIPPLRERGRDIDVLAQAFVDKYARLAGRTLAPLSEATLERLRGYAWPGNVRELQNVIERGVILSTHGVFEIERALPEAARPAPRRRAPNGDDRVLTVEELLALERANIERALAQAGGKVAGPKGAAALLGIHSSTLNSRLRSLGIGRPPR